MTHPADPDLATLLRDARLDEARTAAAAAVRAKPDDARARLDLADVLIVLGEWDRADNHVDLAGTYDPSRAASLALVRQLIRAAAWRDQTFAERRPPDLVTGPDAGIAAALASLAGAPVPAGESPALVVTVDGQRRDGFRDLDDRMAGVLEVLTGDGRYLWIPLSQIASLRPTRPERLRDLVWRPAAIEIVGGANGIVHIPALYPVVAGEGDATHRLGRATDWIETADGGLRGIGQRGWLAGDDILTLDDFDELGIAP
jgi:type VI secretion system protein ImpE